MDFVALEEKLQLELPDNMWKKLNCHMTKKKEKIEIEIEINNIKYKDCILVKTLVEPRTSGYKMVLIG